MALLAGGVIAAAQAVDPRRRDGIRVALDAGEPPRPELAAAAALLGRSTKPE